VECEQTLDPANDARALLDKMLALALDPFRILFLDGRDVHGSGNARVSG